MSEVAATVLPKRLLIACLAVLALTGGCQRSAPEREPREPAPAFAYINTGDLRARPQLLSGWWPIEDGAWRWMAQHAEAQLAVPSNAEPGFELHLFFPPDQLRKAGGPVTATVLFDGVPFAEESYTIPGQYTLAKPVPSGLLHGPSVKVAIRLSRAAPPTATDQRELGAVVSGFGFVPTGK